MDISDAIIGQIEKIPRFSGLFDYNGPLKNIRQGYIPSSDFQEIINPLDKIKCFCDDIEGVGDKLFIVFNWTPINSISCGKQRIRVEFCIFGHRSNFVKVRQAGSSLHNFFHTCFSSNIDTEEKIILTKVLSESFSLKSSVAMAHIDCEFLMTIDKDDLLPIT